MSVIKDKVAVYLVLPREYHRSGALLQERMAMQRSRLSLNLKTTVDNRLGTSEEICFLFRPRNIQREYAVFVWYLRLRFGF